MSGVTKKLMSAAGGVAGEFTAIEDVFSTYLYTGNGSTQTITNYIDLAGEGGLVWIKNRSSVLSHVLSSEQGTFLSSNFTGPLTTLSSAGVTSFNSDGFTLNDTVNFQIGVNFPSGNNFVSWTFRKAVRFFDVVTYTGNGVAGREIAHDLSADVGSIFIKKTSGSSNWQVYHRSLGATQYAMLNEPDASYTSSTRFNDTEPTGSSFTVGGSHDVNQSGQTYVAYLFAHDPLGPSGDGSDGLIDCGSYTGTGAAGNFIDLGWEPQWILIKNASATGDWLLMDNMRGATSTSASFLFANTAAAETQLATTSIFEPKATGFNINNTGPLTNTNGANYIYIAIRRGPMRAPDSGTEVFDAELFTAGSTVFQPDFPPDMNLHLFNRSLGGGVYNGSRMTGNSAFLVTSSPGAEGSFGGSWKYDGPTGTFAQGLSTGTSSGGIEMMFRRAPEFFDVVAYTGDSAGQDINHNLGVAPELVIVKARGQSYDWYVWSTGLTSFQAMQLNTTAAKANYGTIWGFATPPVSETTFTVGGDFYVNSSSSTYIAYLFATLAGVSKVGSYTGNGSSQTINCGFTTGARFILIKRTDSTGDWYVWDTARGIVAGNDPFLKLNTGDAEVTSDDSIDPDSSGFIVNQTGTTNVNVNAASYIFYAIA